MSRTQLDEAVARQLREQAGSAPTGRAVVARVRARTVEAPAQSARRRFLAPLLAAGVVALVMAGVAILPRIGTGGLVPGSDGGGDLPACRLADLQVDTVAGVDGSSMVILFHNTSGPTCSMIGYPDVQLFSGGTLGPAPAQTVSGLAGGWVGRSAPEEVDLVTGDTASAMIESVAADATDTAGCGTADGVTVKLPPGQAMVQVTVPLALSLCADEVHPVVPGGAGVDDQSAPSSSTSFPIHLYVHCGMRVLRLYGQLWTTTSRPQVPTATSSGPASVDGTMTYVHDTDTLRFTVASGLPGLSGSTIVYTPDTRDVASICAS